jgi:hypothetical protein
MKKRWKEKREEMLNICSNGGKANKGLKKSAEACNKQKGHVGYFSKEYLGEERYNEINEKRRLKISKNSNKEACKRGQKIGADKRKTLPNYGLTEEGRRKISVALSKANKGKHPWNYGLTKFTNESIRKQAEAKTIHQDRIDRRAYGWTLSLRQKIRNRDGWRCSKCGKPQKEIKGVLCVHHVDFDPKNNFEDNLISMCRSCHNAYHSHMQPKRAKLSRDKKF